MTNISENFVKKIKIYILFSITFQKILPFMRRYENSISIWYLLFSSTSPGDIRIIAGVVMLNRSSYTIVRHSVSAIFVHENYSADTHENDIALIRVCYYNLEVAELFCKFPPLHGNSLTVLRRTYRWKLT
jgi:hypothetical protein